jgi:hypothetical protein
MAYGRKEKKMKSASITVILLSLAFAVTVFAVEGGQPPSMADQTFDQKQSHILKMLDERIASLQEGRTCVQAAKNDEDLKACREKHMTEMKDRHNAMRQRRGMMGDPQAQ